MTVNEQMIQGNWKQLKGQLKEKWGQLTDDELDRVEGNADQLVGLVQRKTGESREAIERQLDEWSSQSGASFAKAGETVRNMAGQASQRVQDASQQVADSVHDMSEEAMKQMQAGYIQTKRVVQNRPVESLAVCFGVGLVTGLVAGLVMRTR